MFNLFVLLIHALCVGILTLIALRMGKEALIAWMGLLAITMNLFVLKQVTLFSLCVTSTDALGVGYLLGLNLIQEYFGREAAKRSVWISLLISSAFVLLSWIHLFYIPHSSDRSHAHFAALLRPMLRVILASLFSFLFVQWIDIKFFALMRAKTEGKFLTTRVTISLFFSQTIDTLLFSFLALYGTVASLTDIIFFSLIVKILVIFFSTPFVTFSKKMIRHVPV